MFQINSVLEKTTQPESIYFYPPKEIKAGRKSEILFYSEKVRLFIESAHGHEFIELLASKLFGLRGRVDFEADDFSPILSTELIAFNQSYSCVLKGFGLEEQFDCRAIGEIPNGIYRFKFNWALRFFYHATESGKLLDTLCDDFTPIASNLNGEMNDRQHP